MGAWVGDRWRRRLRSRQHLANHHRADAATLANHGYVQCPSGCSGAFCILPKDNRNGQSGLRNHLTAGGNRSPHTALRLASPSGTWVSVEDELRQTCSATAAPGTLGASLTLLSPTAAAAAGAQAPTASPDASRAQPTPAALAPPSDATDPDLDFPIPTLAPSVDLRCALAIPFDDVRRVSRRLHCQELPTSKRQQSEILAPLIFVDHAAGTDPTCERAGCGLSGAGARWGRRAAGRDRRKNRSRRRWRRCRRWGGDAAVRRGRGGT